MPRNYKRERELAIKRGETKGSDSGNAKRKRARRAYEKKNGPVPKGMELDHKRGLAKGGSNSSANLRLRSKSENRAAGGRAGDASKKGKPRK